MNILFIRSGKKQYNTAYKYTSFPFSSPYSHIPFPLDLLKSNPLISFKMATTSIQAPNFFNVNGLVAVITGGGSGIFPFPPQYHHLINHRNWSHDGSSPSPQRRLQSLHPRPSPIQSRICLQISNHKQHNPHCLRCYQQRSSAICRHPNKIRDWLYQHPPSK